LYRLTHNTGTNSNSMINVTVINGNQTTEINKTISNNLVAVYPNPNNGVFYIKLNQYENTVVEVYNTIGQRVLVQSLQGNISSLNMVNLNSGIYQVRVLRANNLIYQTKLIKQN
ncbi:MAG TPA: T9SS type A sorting domain-containing protein, partial [Bacteroidia bacterium]|nr:T9SS type A sorting domain-containing protein [Bacteroidia bacterium]